MTPIWSLSTLFVPIFNLWTAFDKVCFYEVGNNCLRSRGHFQCYVYSKMNSYDLFIRVRSQILLVGIIVLWGAAGRSPGPWVIISASTRC